LEAGLTLDFHQSSPLPKGTHLIVQDVGLGNAAGLGHQKGPSDLDSRCEYHDQIQQRALKQSPPMPGVIIVPKALEIGRAIDELEIVIECSKLRDLENQVQYLPL